MKKSLDLDAVRAFVFVADLASFTRAADVLQMAQAAVSIKIKRLEDRLGYRLLDRTPRHVKLSDQGMDFIKLARELLLAHERALAAEAKVAKTWISIGISEQAAGPELPSILKKMNEYDPAISLKVNVGTSRDLLVDFELGNVDAIVIRRDLNQTEGDLLFKEDVGWFASPQYILRSDEPLGLVSLSTSCRIRSLATDALDDAGLLWQETFVGGGMMAINAAVGAGLGVTALATRLAPAGSLDVQEKFNLPSLPPSEVATKVRRTDKKTAEAIELFLAILSGPIG